MPRQSKKKSTDNVNNEGIINVLDSDKKKGKQLKKREQKLLSLKLFIKIVTKNPKLIHKNHLLRIQKKSLV